LLFEGSRVMEVGPNKCESQLAMVHVDWLCLFPDQFETLMQLGHKQDHFSNTVGCPRNITASLVHAMCPSTIKSMGKPQC